MKAQPLEETIAHRLKILSGHSDALLKMLENNRDYKDIFVQIDALRGSLKNVENLFIEMYIRREFEGLSKKSRTKIENVVSLLRRT